MSKLYTVGSHLRILELYDPILLIQYRYLLLGAAAIEIICVAALLTSRYSWFKGLILLWLGANFFSYRAALALSGVPTPCPCFGSVGSRLGLSPAVADFLTRSIVLFLLAAGAYLLYQHRHCARNTTRMRDAESVIKDGARPLLQA